MKNIFYLFIFAVWVAGFGQTQRDNTVCVDGIGKVSVAPDLAQFYIGVMIVDQNYDSALIKLDKAITKLYPIIDKFEVKKEDYKINAVSSSENQTYDGQKFVTNGFKASKEIEVTYRKMETLSDFLREVVQRGGNNVSTLRFSHSNIDSLRLIAMELAVDDAKKKAETICQRAHVILGKPLAFYAALSRYDFPMESSIGGSGIESVLGGAGGYAENEPAPTSETTTSKDLYRIKPGVIEIQNMITATYEIISAAKK